MSNCIEQLSEFLKIDVTEKDYLSRVGSYLRSIDTKDSCSIEILEDYGLRIASKRMNKHKKRTLIIASLEEPDAGSGPLWPTNSFNPHNIILRDDRLYGSGTCHSKADFFLATKALINVVSASTPISSEYEIVGFLPRGGQLAPAVELYAKRCTDVAAAILLTETNGQLVGQSYGELALAFDIPYSAQELQMRAKNLMGDLMRTELRVFRSMQPALVTNSSNSAMTALVKYLRKIPSDRTILNIDSTPFQCRGPQQVTLELDSESTAYQSNASKLVVLDELISRLEMKLALDEIEAEAFLASIQTTNLSLKLSARIRFFGEDSERAVERCLEWLEHETSMLNVSLDVTGYLPALVCSGHERLPRHQPTVAGLLAKFFSEVCCFGGASVTNRNTVEESRQIKEIERTQQFYQRLMVEDSSLLHSTSSLAD